MSTGFSNDSIENRLIQLKGFGEKTQLDLKKKIEYFLKSRDKFRYAVLENEALVLIEKIKKILPNTPISLIGEMRRRLPIVHKIEILIGSTDSMDVIFNKKTGLTLQNHTDNFFYRHTRSLPWCWSRRKRSSRGNCKIN